MLPAQDQKTQGQEDQQVKNKDQRIGFLRKYLPQMWTVCFPEPYPEDLWLHPTEWQTFHNRIRDFVRGMNTEQFGIYVAAIRCGEIERRHSDAIPPEARNLGPRVLAAFGDEPTTVAEVAERLCWRISTTRTWVKRLIVEGSIIALQQQQTDKPGRPSFMFVKASVEPTTPEASNEQAEATAEGAAPAEVPAEGETANVSGGVGLDVQPEVPAGERDTAEQVLPE